VTDSAARPRFQKKGWPYDPRQKAVLLPRNYWAEAPPRSPGGLEHRRRVGWWDSPQATERASDFASVRRSQRRVGRADGMQLSYNRAMPPESKAPPSAMVSSSTVRERISAALREAALTAREISQRASVPERDVAEHLRHLEHSLVHAGERLFVSAPLCLKCGFAFTERERHGRPSRCPRCKSERISPPCFRIVR